MSCLSEWNGHIFIFCNELFSENCDYELLSYIFLEYFLYPASVCNGSAKVCRAQTRKPDKTA